MHNHVMRRAVASLYRGAAMTRLLSEPVWESKIFDGEWVRGSADESYCRRTGHRQAVDDGRHGNTRRRGNRCNKS